MCLEKRGSDHRLYVSRKTGVRPNYSTYSAPESGQNYVSSTFATCGPDQLALASSRCLRTKVAEARSSATTAEA
jgi:hypothetical protein